MINFSGIPEDNLNRARDVGTAAHRATQYYDENRLDMDTVTEEIKPYLDAYIAFKEATGFVPEEIEQPVANLTWGYACTPDRRGRFRGNPKRFVIEFKKAMHQDWHHVQNAAQRACFPDNPNGYVLELMPNGKWKPHIVRKLEEQRYRQLWQSAVQVYHFAHKGEKDLWRPR